MRALGKLYWWLFTYFHPALQILRKNRVKSLLDVGCGKGGPVKMLKCYKVGVDLNLRELKGCLKEKTHDDLILADATHLPFRDKCFDAVICLQVLHFIPKRDGWIAIKDMERAARKLVVLAMPIGAIPEMASDGWESMWKPTEFTPRGYSVKLYGFRFLHRLALRKTGTLCSKLIFSIDPFINVFQSFIPCTRDYMICCKRMRLYQS